MRRPFLAGGPPSLVRKLEAVVLMRAFARAFGERPPSVRGLSANEALDAFASYTAERMRAALALDDGQATLLRERLGSEAVALGRALRRSLPLAPRYAFPLAQYCYQGIGIRLQGSPAEGLRFGPCAFARYYGPHECWFMSAFDEGFLCGLLGLDNVRLEFSCRLTQGAGCCRAQLTHG